MNERWKYLGDGPHTKLMSNWAYLRLTCVALIAVPFIGWRSILKDLLSALESLLVVVLLLGGPLFFWLIGPPMAIYKKRQHERALDAANLDAWNIEYALATGTDNAERAFELENEHPVVLAHERARLKRLVRARALRWFAALVNALSLGWQIGTAYVHGWWGYMAAMVCLLAASMAAAYLCLKKVRDNTLPVHEQS